MMNSLKRLLPVFMSALAVLAGCSPSAPTTGLASGSTAALVDIGGRKLNVLMRGKGMPTVVIEAGMGEPGASSGGWNRVVDEIAKTHPVLIYDRAGLGGSDPAKIIPRTSRDVASDLNALLNKVAPNGPVLLVGHSYGGMHIRMFAHQYPAKVLGMVLVDSTHPDQDAKWLAALPPAGPKEAEGISGARRFLAGRTDPSSNPEKIDPVASSDQVRGARGLGDKPLVILTHASSYRMDANLPEALAVKLEKVSAELQGEMKTLSTNGKLLQSANGGHSLHTEDPELVISGIKMTLEAAKNGGKL